MKFPWLVGGLGIILAIWQVVREIKNPDESGHAAKEWKEYLYGMGWFIAIFPIVLVLGIIVGAPVYIFAALKGRGERLVLSALLTVAVWAFLYFGLYVALNIPLYEGIIWG